MRLRIEHTTAFAYADPISESYAEFRLKPLDVEGQRCSVFALGVEPMEAEIFAYTDRFGNDVRHVDVLRMHAALRVRATSEVVTSAAYVEPCGVLSPLQAFDYLQPTPLTEELSLELPIVEHAARDRALALMHTVHGSLTYTKGSTAVTTTAAQALALGKGVCQDFSHVMLAACRSAGFAARYVSGYLFTHGMQGNNFDEAATHAWVDVLIPGVGWWSLDPTHDMPQGERHVRLAIGRDYADVPPTRGVFKGSSREVMTVNVEIRQL